MSRSLTRTLITISVYAFALSFLWNTLHPLVLPYIIARLEPELKNTYLGLISSAGLIVATVVQPLAGRVSDRSRSRWGRRRPFIIGGTLFDLIFLAIIAISGNIWLLFIGYCLLQTSSNVAHGPYQGLIPDLVPDSKKGVASGAKSLAELIALVLGSAAIGALLGRDLTAAAIGAIAGVLLVALIITIIHVREEQPTHDAVDSAVPPLSLSHVGAALRQHSVFAWYIVSRLCILAGLAAVRTFAQNYIQDVLQADNAAQQAGQLMTILGIAVLLVVLPAGYLADRFGRKRLNVASALIGGLGTLLFLNVRDFNDLVLYGAIVGVAVGAFMSANWALAMDLIPAADAALFLGLTNLATAGSGAIVGLLGPVIDVVNRSAPGLGYTVIFAAASALWFAGGLILLRLPLKR